MGRVRPEHIFSYLSSRLSLRAIAAARAVVARVAIAALAADLVAAAAALVAAAARGCPPGAAAGDPARWSPLAVSLCALGVPLADRTSGV